MPFSRQVLPQRGVFANKDKNRAPSVLIYRVNEINLRVRIISLFNVLGLDHVGIRVSDFYTSYEFYRQLGFTNYAIDDDGDYELWTDTGLRINLIANAESAKRGHNILLDEPVKYAGYTHAAFIIKDLAGAAQRVKAEGIEITEGPKESPRRKYFFIRDPDGNVLEFNELKG